MTSQPAVSAGDLDLESYRRELTAYCYRMLGSTFEAEDAVQETMLRSWRSSDRFEGRSQLRTWLYRIATNVCLDALAERKRRNRPMDLGPPRSAQQPMPAPRTEENLWIEPIPDERVLPGEGNDPEELAIARESVKLAFMAALQHLPPKQRAVLILREVLRWRASEVADLLDTSVASVNSALQRARETLSTRHVSLDTATPPPLDDESQKLVAQYAAAFEAYDMDALTELLRKDAVWNMPPFDMWLQTHKDIVTFCLGPGIGCLNSRLIPVSVNGSPGFAQYKPADDGSGRLEPWAIQVVEIDNGRISGLTFFLDTQRFFPLWDLPDHLDA